MMTSHTIMLPPGDQTTSKQVPAGEQLVPPPEGAPGRCSTTLLGWGMHGLQSDRQSAPPGSLA